MFGAEGYDDVPISTAVRASGALPMVYAPVEVKGRELIDGGIVSTTNLDIAVEAGAKLVVVINPLVPFVNDFAGQMRTLRGTRPRRVSDMGFAQIGYQTFKLLAHQRLHEMAERWEERYPGVDIVLIEPEPTDELMFTTSMMNFTSRVEIARHGFQSVTKHLAGEYEHYREICERHGLEISAKRVNKVVAHFEVEQEEDERLAEDPRGHDRRAPPPDRARTRASALSSAPSRRSEHAASRRLMRTWRGSPRASPPATSTPARARRATSSPPSTVGWATHRKLAWLSATSKWRSRSAAVSATRSSEIRRTRSATSSEQLRSASRAPAWETSETPRSGASSASSSSEPGPPSA